MDEKTAGSHIESIPFTEDEFYMKRSGRERQDSDRNYSLPLWVRGTASAVDEVVVYGKPPRFHGSLPSVAPSKWLWPIVGAGATVWGRGGDAKRSELVPVGREAHKMGLFVGGFLLSPLFLKFL